VFLFPLENTLELFVLWLAGAILYVTLFFIAEVPRQFSTSYGEKNLSLTSFRVRRVSRWEVRAAQLVRYHLPFQPNCNLDHLTRLPERLRV